LALSKFGDHGHQKENNRRAQMERRKYPRVETRNLISYVSIGDNGAIKGQSMGKALNISQNGIFLETTRLIFSESISLMSVDVDNHLIEIWGKVVYSMEYGSGKFGNGIRFQGAHNENIQFAMKLIKVFHNRRNPSAAIINLQGSGKNP
jgi:hypothetical protein